MTVAIRKLTVSVAKISAKTRWVFVEIACNDGAVGSGEATLNGSESALLAAAGEYATRLWSLEIANPGAFAEVAAPKILAQAAMVSALDMALWDLHAQHVGTRLVDVLGGPRRTPVPVYANINRRTENRTPEGFAQSARDALGAEFGALKIAPFDEVSPQRCANGDGVAAMQAGLARIGAVRAVAGSACRLMVDCHWRFDEATAADLIDAATEYGVYWIECPLPETLANIAALVRLRASANARGIRLAGLEESVGYEGFRPYCEAGAYDVMMPDVKYVGGLGEMLRCAESFARHGVGMSPHNPSGPLAHAASLHVSAAMMQFDMLELQFDESPLFDRLIAGGLPPCKGGMATLPAMPGLGVRLDATCLAANAELTPSVWEAP